MLWRHPCALGYGECLAVAGLRYNEINHHTEPQDIPPPPRYSKLINLQRRIRTGQRSLYRGVPQSTICRPCHRSAVFGLRRRQIDIATKSLKVSQFPQSHEVDNACL